MRIYTMVKESIRDIQTRKRINATDSKVEVVKRIYLPSPIRSEFHSGKAMFEIEEGVFLDYEKIKESDEQIEEFFKWYYENLKEISERKNDSDICYDIYQSALIANYLRASGNTEFPYHYSIHFKKLRTGKYLFHGDELIQTDKSGIINISMTLSPEEINDVFLVRNDLILYPESYEYYHHETEDKIKLNSREGIAFLSQELSSNKNINKNEIEQHHERLPVLADLSEEAKTYAHKISEKLKAIQDQKSPDYHSKKVIHLCKEAASFICYPLPPKSRMGLFLSFEKAKGKILEGWTEILGNKISNLLENPTPEILHVQNLLDFINENPPKTFDAIQEVIKKFEGNALARDYLNAFLNDFLKKKAEELLKTYRDLESRDKILKDWDEEIFPKILELCKDPTPEILDIQHLLDFINELPETFEGMQEVIKKFEGNNLVKVYLGDFLKKKVKDVSETLRDLYTENKYKFLKHWEEEIRVKISILHQNPTPEILDIQHLLNFIDNPPQTLDDMEQIISKLQNDDFSFSKQYIKYFLKETIQQKGRNIPKNSDNLDALVQVAFEEDVVKKELNDYRDLRKKEEECFHFNFFSCSRRTKLSSVDNILGFIDGNKETLTSTDEEALKEHHFLTGDTRLRKVYLRHRDFFDEMLRENMEYKKLMKNDKKTPAFTLSMVR